MKQKPTITLIRCMKAGFYGMTLTRKQMGQAADKGILPYCWHYQGAKYHDVFKRGTLVFFETPAKESDGLFAGSVCRLYDLLISGDIPSDYEVLDKWRDDFLGAGVFPMADGLPNGSPYKAIMLALMPALRNAAADNLMERIDDAAWHAAKKHGGRKSLVAFPLLTAVRLS